VPGIRFVGIVGVLWPPPKRGESAVLTCGCVVAVVLQIPFVFLYWVRIRVREPHCGRSHSVGSNRIVRLERLHSKSGTLPRDSS